MQTHTTSENQNSHAAHDLGQICTIHAKPGTREHVEITLAAIGGMSLSKTIEACNGLERGSYRVTVKASSDWNEITVKLWDSHALVASSYIDRGHTKETRTQAAQDVIDNVRMYLCR